MTVLELLSHLRAQGIKVWVEDERLRYRAPERALTAGLRAEISSRKPEIVRFLSRLRDDARGEMPPIRPVPRDSEKALPLSFSQQRLWFLDRLNPGVPIYNMYEALELRKPIDAGALRRAFTELVGRHEILRTAFPSVAGVPVQAIAPAPAEFPLPVIDLSGLQEEERREEAERLRIADTRLPFDLAKGPLLAAKLLKFDDAHYWLLLAFHHIVMDDWSRKIFDQELDTLYTSFSQGRPSPLAALPIQFGDFAAWQREWMRGDVLESYIGYWAEQLKGELPALDLPADRPRSQSQSSSGAEGKFTFSRSLSQAIKEFSDREGVTPFMTMIAAYGALLSRYTGREDIIIGSPVADRNQPETRDLVGFLLNTLPLRIDLSGDPPFRGLLRRVREVCLGAHDHQEVPYESLLHRLHLNRDLSGSPLFQTMFVLLNTPNVTSGASGLWSRSSGANDGDARPFTATRNNGTTKFDLSFVLEERNGRIHGIAEYNAGLFDHDTIARLVGRLETLVDAAVGRPELRVSELPLMSAAEREGLIAGQCGREVGVTGTGGSTVIQLFESRVERNPEAIAVECLGQRYTYPELNARANQWARYLQRRGVGPEVMAGILMERSFDMLAAQLGTLKAGAACVPLDPSYPEKRLEDIQPGILITRECQVAAEDTTNIPCQVSGDNLAYVLYTSGSTGAPKGVMLTHDALLNHTVSAIEAYGLTGRDRVLQFASVGFDASLEEIYPCLATGGTLVLRGEEMLDSIATFVARCRELAITVLDLPTAYWHEVVSRLETEALQMPPELRLVILGGERALPEKLSVWRNVVGDRVVLMNTYGPTEGTIVVTRCVLDGTEVPIGRPIENTRTYVLDKRMQLAPIGIPGELFIGGTPLARGYLNRPDLTADRFVPDPITGKPGARLYRTGDVVRMLPGGNLEYRGRTDAQVKIRGYRIEPGEIATVLRTHPDVQDAVVLAREDQPGMKRLIAYVVPRPAATAIADESALRTFLKPRLPDYMLPAEFVFLESLPLNANGKIDYRALPAPDRNRTHLAAELEAPRTPIETALLSIWTGTLKLDRIGIHESFFDLGGHSLLATQVVSRISDEFQIEMPLRRLFELPTIAELSAEVEQLLRTSSGAGARLRIGASVEQMLTALEGLTEREVGALLGENEHVPSA